MLFNSYSYLLFLAFAVVFVYLTAPRCRVYVYLVLSIFFYAMWRLDFTALVVVCAGVSYASGHCIERCKTETSKKFCLVAGLFVNISILVFFKYSYLIYDTYQALFSRDEGAELTISIILPLGISFYIFQAISYPIDIYRRVTKPSGNFLIFLSFIMFWPQIIAGPILRKNEVVPQLLANNRFDFGNIQAGTRRILQGLFKKVILADFLARAVDSSYGSGVLETYTAYDVWVMAFLFGFQIYFDFSGYSDIALGSARLFGISLPENFNYPYLAKSPRDFWQRWHISLSSWVRDYLYLPLTGNRFQTRSVGGIAVAVEKQSLRYSWALFLAWFMMGLWHGAEWKFALWGVYHATWIWVYRNVSFLQVLTQRYPFGSWALTLLVSMAGWIFFRVITFSDAVVLYTKLITPSAYMNLLGHQLSGMYYLWCVFLLIGMVFCWHYKSFFEANINRMKVGSFVESIGYGIIVFVVLLELKPVEQFIYFQF